jgi:hypothetical protein
MEKNTELRPPFEEPPLLDPLDAMNFFKHFGAGVSGLFGLRYSNQALRLLVCAAQSR